MSEFKAGVTAPPFHPWCRTCTCPYFDDEFSKGGERFSRLDDGTVEYVPSCHKTMLEILKGVE